MSRTLRRGGAYVVPNGVALFVVGARNVSDDPMTPFAILWVFPIQINIRIEGFYWSEVVLRLHEVEAPE